MTIKTKTNQTNQPIKSNRSKPVPVVIIPTYKSNQEKPLNQLQTSTKSNHKPIENNLHELPKIGKIDSSFISRQTRSKAKESENSSIPINDKRESNVEVSKRIRDETNYKVPIILIPSYHEIQKKSTDSISDSLNFINLQNHSKTSTNSLQKWLKEIEIENTLDPNSNQEIKNHYNSLNFTNDDLISNLTSSASIELVTLTNSNNNVKSNQPIQSTSKAIEINENESFNSTSENDKINEKVKTKALSKPISNINVPPPQTESSLEYIDPIDYNPTPTPPRHSSLSPLDLKPIGLLRPDQPEDSPKSSVLTIKRKRMKSIDSNSERNSIILNQDGLPISSQRDREIYQELNDPFGFQINEKRLKVLRSKGELERTRLKTSFKFKSIKTSKVERGEPLNVKTNLKNPGELSMDSDLSLTDLLSIKKPNQNRKVKGNHRIKKNILDSRDQNYLENQSEENDVNPTLRRGRSKKDTIIKSPFRKKTTDQDIQAESSIHSINQPSLKKLQRKDLNTINNKQTEPIEVHQFNSSPSSKKPLIKSNQLKKLPKPNPLMNQKQVKKLNKVSQSNQVFEMNRELRVKYFDGLDDFDFEEEIVL